MAGEYKWFEDEAFIAELDERFMRWEDGTELGFSVDEVKAEPDQLREEHLKLLLNERHFQFKARIY